jgi:RimJ/RimL family protein N-acetyltransferase
MQQDVAPSAPTLRGRRITLVPLLLDQLDDLCAAVDDWSIFRWYPVPMRGAEDMQGFIETALMERDAGRAIPFAVIDTPSGRVIGSTRLMSIDRHHRRAEIGATWYGPRWQRTGRNTEAKLLLLQHAFTSMSLLRVEFKTDSRNVASRQALAGIGAVQEGISRYHMINPDGSSRDSVWFAITTEEWRSVETRLISRLTKDDKR